MITSLVLHQRLFQVLHRALYWAPYYFNDLPSNIESLVKLYDDDVLIMRSIITPNDHQVLQNDVTKLAVWSPTRQMPFNLAKCEHLTATNKPHPSIYHYKINDYNIQKVESIKYLGLTISHNLLWLPHISKISGKVILKLNKNTLGVKKVRGQSEATYKQAGATKSFEIS